MARKTKKVGPAGRLGARYGVRIRKRIADVELVSKGKHECPKCKAVAMGRTSSGVWVCRHCGAKIASSSYMPTPPAAVRRELAEVLAAVETKERAPEELAPEELPRPKDEKG